MNSVVRRDGDGMEVATTQLQRCPTTSAASTIEGVT